MQKQNKDMFRFINVIQNKFYEARVAHLKNMPVQWYVLRFYDLLKFNKLKWQPYFIPCL